MGATVGVALRGVLGGVHRRAGSQTLEAGSSPDPLVLFMENSQW